jgi:ferredoxin
MTKTQPFRINTPGSCQPRRMHYICAAKTATSIMDVKITVVDRQGEAHELEAPTDMNMNLMEVCKAYELPVKGTCGGMALCSTCHVYVESGHELPEMGEDEEDMLDQAFFVEDNSRLGCQLRITPELNGLKVLLAPEDEEA